MHREKFARLAARTLKEAITDPTTAVSELRESVGSDLPEPYLAMLLDYRGAIVFDRSVCYRPLTNSPFDRDNGTQVLEVLYGLGTGPDSVIDALETFTGRIPASTLPIGAAPGGNQICLVLSGPKIGEVYFWHLEREGEIIGEEDHDFQNMYLIARSLQDFVSRLEVDPESPDGDGIIESESWLDV